jgi:hypothetical protein
MGKFISSRFQSVCSETGKTIKQGDQIYFDGKAYSNESKTYKDRKQAGQIFALITAK